MKHLSSYNYKFLAALVVGFLTLQITLGQSEIQASIDNLLLPDSAKSHLHLPLISADGETTFSWASESSIINTNYQPGYTPSVQTPPGYITRPEIDTDVTLSVTAKKGDSTITKDYQVSVLAKPDSNVYVGYLYAYFKSVSGQDEVQQIHFAISDDGIRWRDLNENQPILTSVLGDKCVRDPYIIRSPEGDHFYLIATDLNIYDSKYNNNWGLMATQGSTSLMIWESDDLINWSDQRMINVAGSIQAGNAWAPESIYDEKTGEYLVYWSSLVAADNYSKHRIWVSKTRDFTHFTTPQIYVETGDGNIDASMYKTNGKYYRLIKNDSKLYVYLESSEALLDYTNNTGLGNSFVHINNSNMESYTGGYEGATMFKFIDEEKWCVLIDEYVGARRGYIPFFSTAITQSNSLTLATDGSYLMPTGAKHGTVIPITQDEYDSLTAKWSVKPTHATSNTKPIAQYTFDGWESGNSITDQSGNDNNASLLGNATVINDSEKGKVLYLDGTSNTYFSFPQGMLDAMDSITISMDIKPQSTENYHFVLGIGQDNYKYAFLRIRANEARFATTTESYNKEQEVKTSGSFLNQWMNLKIIKSGHITKLYINNELVDQNHNTRNISDLGSQLQAYIGKSFYNGDPYFKGCFDNIYIYNRCINENEFSTSIKKKAPNKSNKITVSQPNEKELNIHLQQPLDWLNISLFDMNGTLKSNLSYKHPNNIINISTIEYNPGVYLLKFTSNLNSFTSKIVL